ncbi:hypothetical protein ACFVW2_07130 [Streptomyces sp. NPDC058171]
MSESPWKEIWPDDVSRRPVPHAVNVHVDEVQEQALEWARDIGIVSSEKYFQECMECGYARFSSLAYPNASLADLSLVTRWIVFLFTVDVHTDETPYDSLSPEYLTFLRNMGAIVSPKANSPIEPASLKTPFGRALLELWTTSRTHFKNPGWERRFARYFHEFQSSVLWEIALRRTGEVPDYLTFSTYKLRSCVAPIGVGLVEPISPYVLHRALPAARNPCTATSPASGQPLTDVTPSSRESAARHLRQPGRGTRAGRRDRARQEAGPP